ncbi:hypothetical protein SHKM778_25440 [Streptomyces sp. KM77-8]|uniref:Uncharacterized protein n=1 Tax=Streptomyces haneummycinicus TaxID=3074435 RepID=A0AAT9HFT4_9ACTN
MGVVDEDVGLVGGGHGDDGEVAGGRVADDALGAVGAEADGLSVFEADDGFFGLLAVLEDVEGAVVEDVAVLVDLDECGAGVVGGLAQDLGEVFAVGVDGAGDEGRFRADGEGDGVEGASREPIGVDLVILPTSEVGSTGLW